MNPILIVPIVEGHGEYKAVPVLLHRMAEDRQVYHLKVNQPIRVKASSFFQRREEFCRYVQLAANKAAQGNGLVLILMDCEDDCPAELGPSLLERAKEARSDVQYLCVLAHREYETWFIAAADSLAGYSGLKTDLSSLLNPESRRDAKGWLTENMPNDTYEPIRHQAKFTAQFSFEQAETVPSFKRFRDKLTQYLERFVANEEQEQTD